MVAKGATTIWERWNGDTGDVSMNSYNHYALGAVCGFLFRRIAGIEETAPGFAEFRVKPLFDPRVASGGADYDSVRGRISTRWRRRSGGKLSLDVTVPGNTRAEIYLPTSNEATVTEAGRSLDGRQEFHRLGVVAGRVALSVGAGAYSFRSALDV